jgi:hypothetical protein
MEAMISSMDGSDGDFPAGMKHLTISTNLGPAPGNC